MKRRGLESLFGFRAPSFFPAFALLCQRVSAALRKRDIFLLFAHILIRWTDDFARIDDFLDAVGAPAGYAGSRKNGCVQLNGQIQHAVDKAAIKIDICAYALINAALAGDNLGREPLDQRVERRIFLSAFFLRELAYGIVQDQRARVRQRIHRVSHTIDQPTVVECSAFRAGPSNISPTSFLACPVAVVLLHILKHAAPP